MVLGLGWFWAWVLDMVMGGVRIGIGLGTLGGSWMDAYRKRCWLGTCAAALGGIRRGITISRSDHKPEKSGGKQTK